MPCGPRDRRRSRSSGQAPTMVCSSMAMSPAAGAPSVQSGALAATQRACSAAHSSAMLAQHREPGAHVLAALVIVRRRRQHRVRMAGGARQHAGMEGRGIEGRRSRRRSRHRCARAAGRSDRRRCPRPPWRRPARSIAGSARWPACRRASANRRRTASTAQRSVARQVLRAPSAACCSTVRSTGERAPSAP